MNIPMNININRNTNGNKYVNGNGKQITDANETGIKER